MECQFEELEACPQCEEDLDQLLNSLPQSLDETYARMLSHINPKLSEKARQVLNMLCYSIRPMTVSELIDGVAVEMGESPRFNPKRRYKRADDIKLICPGFVEIGLDSHSHMSTVRIGHFSVQEFLESGRMPQKQAEVYAVRKADAHAQLSCICLTYLLEPSVSLSKAEKDNSLAGYAARYWHEHFVNAEKTQYPLETQVLYLFQDTGAFHNWVSVWNVDDVWGEKPHGQIPSPVYYAALLGLSFVICGFLQWQFDVNSKGGRYGTALQAASVGGHEKDSADATRSGRRCQCPRWTIWQCTPGCII